MRGDQAQGALPYFRQAANLAPADSGAQLGLAQCLEALGGTYLEEATKIYRAIVKRFSDHPVGEMAEQALTRISQQTMRERVGGGVRMDAVMYMQSAIERFARMDPAEVGRITMEIAMLGRNGLEVNDPSVRYTLEGMKGDFSALELLSYMHVGIRIFDPQADTGTGLDQEYEIAKMMRAGT